MRKKALTFMQILPGPGFLADPALRLCAQLAQSRAGWAEGRSEPERFIVAGDRIIVFVHVRARLKDSRQWHEARLADVFTFRNGKVIQMRAFADRQQALKWAGVKDSDAN